LRERIEDIPDLAMHFLRKYCTANGRSLPSINPEALEAMARYHWPGNVRELEHVVERLVILVEGDRIDPVHVSAAMFRSDAAMTSILPKNSEELKALKKQIRESSIQEVEKMFIEEALRRNDWNVSRAARDVDMQRSNFQALMKKYNITRPPQTA
ncbi:MAG TPA: Fis family transcriptional regulator, partial [Bacteroidetes bacterium]|nr:Fis family transcriptional regulator [Bacteroidota bacterium]